MCHGIITQPDAKRRSTHKHGHKQSRREFLDFVVKSARIELCGRESRLPKMCQALLFFVKNAEAMTGFVFFHRPTKDAWDFRDLIWREAVCLFLNESRKWKAKSGQDEFQISRFESTALRFICRGRTRARDVWRVKREAAWLPSPSQLERKRSGRMMTDVTGGTTTPLPRPAHQSVFRGAGRRKRRTKSRWARS